MKTINLFLIVLTMICSLSGCNGLLNVEGTLDSTDYESRDNDTGDTNMYDSGDDDSDTQNTDRNTDDTTLPISETDEPLTEQPKDSTEEEPDTPDSKETGDISDAEKAEIELDDVLEVYHKATKVAAWFRQGSLLEVEAQMGLVDMSDRITKNNMTYFRVQSFASYSAFCEYLGTFFGDELTEFFLGYNGPRYVEHNGYLYGAFGIRGTNVFMGDETYDIEFVNSEKVNLLVKVEVLAKDMVTVEEYRTFVFPYELIDGKWVFTDFPTIR